MNYALTPLVFTIYPVAMPFGLKRRFTPLNTGIGPLLIKLGISREHFKQVASIPIVFRAWQIRTRSPAKR